MPLTGPAELLRTFSGVPTKTIKQFSKKEKGSSRSLFRLTDRSNYLQLAGKYFASIAAVIVAVLVLLATAAAVQVQTT